MANLLGMKKTADLGDTVVGRPAKGFMKIEKAVHKLCQKIISSKDKSKTSGECRS